MSDAFQGPLRALAHRNFRLYFSGQLVSLLGTWMQQIAMSWLAYRLSDSVWVLGVIGFASQIPILLFSPLGGLLSDRIDRHRLLLFTQTLSMIQAFVLATLTLTHVVQVWHLVVLATLLGLVNAVDAPVRQSFAVQLVDRREDLVNAIALNSFAFNVSRLLGPAIAGVLVGWIGEGACFTLNALSYVAVLIALLRVRVRAVSRHTDAILRGLREGFGYAGAFVPIRSLLLICAIMSLCIGPYTVLMPYYAREVFHGDARTLGLLTGCGGLGALLGSLFVASRKRVERLGRYVILASCICATALLAFAVSHALWLSLALLVVMGFGLIVTAASSNTLIQTLVDDRLRGRVMSLYTMAFLGMAPVGSLVMGRVAHYVGVPVTLFAAGAIAIGCVLWLRRGLRGLPAHIAEAYAALARVAPRAA